MVFFFQPCKNIRFLLPDFSVFVPSLAWVSLICCLPSAVTTFNIHTRLVPELKCKHRKSFRGNPSCLPPHQQLSCPAHPRGPCDQLHQCPPVSLYTVSDWADFYSELHGRDFSKESARVEKSRRLSHLQRTVLGVSGFAEQDEPDLTCLFST